MPKRRLAAEAVAKVIAKLEDEVGAAASIAVVVVVVETLRNLGNVKGHPIHREQMSPVIQLAEEQFCTERISKNTSEEAYMLLHQYTDWHGIKATLRHTNDAIQDPVLHLENALTKDHLVKKNHVRGLDPDHDKSVSIIKIKKTYKQELRQRFRKGLRRP